jgi:membrane dipeptidase
MTKATILPIFDGHNDLLFRLWNAKSRRSFFVRGKKGHIDLPRARAGNLVGGFFAAFAPSVLLSKRGDSTRRYAELSHEDAKIITEAMMADLARLEVEAKGKIKIIRTTNELVRCLKRNVLAMIMHIEGAVAIGPNLDDLETYYRKGLRSLGIVWSRSNIFGHGVPFAFPHSPNTGPGLTKAGRSLVKKCNELGVLVDLSHMNEKGFWDIAKISNAPLVATHSNVHAICRASRNLTNKQLDAIKDTDGMVGVNFAVKFLRPDGREDERTSFAVIIRHVDYLVKRLGIDRVGLGSDFDGAMIPKPIGDVSGLPKLIQALREHGYNESALKKITHENWIRVLRLTLK